MLEITFITEKKKPITTKVDSKRLIKDVKNELKMKKILKIFPKVRIWPSYLLLKFNGITLEDNKSLSDYNILNHSQISLFVSVPLPKNIKREIPYNYLVSDFIKDAGEGATSLKVVDGGVCDKKKYVRHYLHQEGIVLQFNKSMNDQSKKVRNNSLSKSPSRSGNKVQQGPSKGTEIKNTSVNKSLIQSKDNNAEMKVSLVTSPQTKSSSLTSVELVEPNKEKSLKLLNKNIDLVSLNVVSTVEKEKNSGVFKIKVDRHCSIEHLLETVSKKLEMGQCYVKVYHLEKLLVKGSLDDYNIKENDNLIVKSKVLNEQFVIKIKSTTKIPGESKLQPYLVDEVQTVKSLKMILRDQNNVNVNSIHLSFNDQELEDESIIRELNIDNGATILLRIDKVIENGDQEIKVKVRNGLGGECKTISINTAAKVEVFMNEVTKQFKDLPEEFVLSYLGDILKNENTLSTYNIGSEDEVVISHCLLIRYFLTGDNYSAKVYRYAFLPEDTVFNLKEKITKKLNFDARSIILSFDGNTLENETVLKDAGIENGSYILMVSTLSGGL